MRIRDVKKTIQKQRGDGSSFNYDSIIIRVLSAYIQSDADFLVLLLNE